MSTRFFLLSMVLMTGSTGAIFAQDSSYFSLSAQLRPKAEYRSGNFRPLMLSEDPAALVSSRQRLNFDYHHKELLDLRVSLQNVSIWGQANAVQPTEKGGNTIGLFEAYGDVKLNGSFRTRFGRQAISLDDERIFGVVDWAQGARSHDALAILYRHGRLDFRFYAAYNQNYKTNYDNIINNPAGNRYATNDAQIYKTMQTLYGKAIIGKYGYMSLVAYNIGMQNALFDTVDKTVRQQQTIGLNYFRTSTKWFISASGFYQMGESATGMNTGAYMFALKAGLPFAKNWDAAIGWDYLSGNDLGKANSTNHAFAVPFATNHKFYGNMDYFFAGNSHGNVGLCDKYVSLGFKPAAKAKLNLMAHWFNSTGEVYVANAKQDSNLGQEIDLNFALKAYPFLELTGGYSTYHTTPTLLIVKNTPGAGEWQHWGWFCANLNLEVLRIKK
ncbi:MAG: alginate export family protein [Bacteroidetes bacterium]|nr:alginate export family protein [Bacteroidota bacterium]